VFWQGCHCMLNRDKPICNTTEKSLSRYEETVARLRKIKDAGYNVVSVWGCEFRKLLRENSGLENELCSPPYFKTSTFNIRNVLYGSRTEATKTWCRVEQGKKSGMWMLSVCTATFIRVNMASFLWVIRQCTWVQTSTDCLYRHYKM